MEALNIMPQDVQQNEEWRIETDMQAEWALKKIAAAKAEAKRMEDLCKEEIRFYEEQAKTAIRNCDFETAPLLNKLREYFATVQPKEGKTQFSYRLPSGSLVLKKARKKLSYTDESLLLDWARCQAPDCIRVQESIKKDDLKARIDFSGDFPVFTDTGEIVPGMELINEPETFEVK